MKLWTSALCLLIACAAAHAKTVVWQPTEGHVQVPVWPATPPDATPVPGPEVEKLPGMGITNVTRPTMTVYKPTGHNTGAAVVVFPGGGFQVLAIGLEGTEICDWLTSKGITCILLKYRVPSVPYVWQCDCRPHNLTLSIPSLEDAQRTMRLVRHHAAEWQIDPHKIGVIGFSAGGYLVAEISTNFDRHLYAPVDDADKESARPDFAMPIYPGHLTTGDDNKLNANIRISDRTPPTFLVQAEDDNVDGVDQSLVYFTALKKANVPTEMHLYAHGGHAFGLRRTGDPITAWPLLAEAWMRTIGVLSN
ncbi:alpha/beta hydrolase [Rhodanobacter sp. L36]|uniref:alpha/beta hydrolase n=1 Tax=Rhodanobacter sp. L36 TaxID=1747221 RepID=UPI00131BB306|nr:alpha/beta hydrolase [Rhodanobacter sp. L36]